MPDFPAAYQVSKGSALAVDQAFYQRIAQSQEARTLVERFVIPILYRTRLARTREPRISYRDL